MNGRPNWKGSVAVAMAVFLAACASTSATRPGPPVREDSPAGEQLSLLIATMRKDMGLAAAHGRPASIPGQASTRVRPKPTTDRNLIQMPVVGVSAWKIRDNFHAPREGGRYHLGLDIFAPRGTPVVAASDGVITYVGVQTKAGRCLWLSADSGLAFFYAHLDHWSGGIREGLRVRRGTVLGYVGNTGNAIHTPSHLHFQVMNESDIVDPLPLLRSAARAHGEPALQGGFGRR